MEFISKPFICGIDEAGRGPLAGPVSAACVILPREFPVEILDDSKKLSEKRRAEAASVIKEEACWGVAHVDHETIDKINILNASLYAMKLAFEEMVLKLPEWALENGIPLFDSSNIEEKILAIVDGNAEPDLQCEIKAEPRADGKYHCVMAASILAKTERDRIMTEYDSLYPEYGYAKHKGYPTPEHKKICRERGPSPIQRLSFKY